MRGGDHMTRTAQREIRLLTMLGDLIAIAAAFHASIWLRLALNPLFYARLERNQMAQLVPPLGLVLILWVIASAWLGLYRPRRGPLARSATVQVAEAMLLAVLLTIVVIFFVRDFGRDFSRSFVLLLSVLGVVAMLLDRALLWGFLRLARRRGYGRERVLIVGRGRGAKSLISRLEREAPDRVNICGVITPTACEAVGVLGNPVPVVGTLANLPALINRHRVDRVIAVEKEVPHDQLQACVSVCTRMGVPLNRTAGMLKTGSARLGITEIGSTVLIEVQGLEFTRAQEVAKRAFDLALASALLLILFPPMLVLAAIIRLASPGPVLYVAPRVGRGGRHFSFYKFRSMVTDAESRREALASRNEKRGHMFKMRSDPRVTPVGRFIRRFSLDELPQLFNVIRGEMSLVGPRPLPAKDLELDGLSREYRFWAKERTKVPPGITGLWQVRGRSALGFENMLRLDIEYVRNRSLLLDMRILLHTVPALLSRKGAC